MSNKFNVPNNVNDPGRREIMQARAATLASMAGSTLVMASPSFAQNTANAGSGTRSEHATTRRSGRGF